MDSKIKGITIELQANVTPLENALKDVDKASSKTSSELTKINSALKFDTNNTVLLAQKQDVLQDAVKNTTARLESLKLAQSDVEKLFSRGEIDASAYREFRREIEITEGKLEGYKREIQSISDEQENLGNATKQLDRLFELTGKSIDDFAHSLNSKLVRAIKEGRASSGQLEMAFNQISRSALGANTDLDRLRSSLQSLDAGGSLDQIRQDLQDVEQEARATTKSIEGLSDVYSALGGVVAGVGIGQVIQNSLETSDIDAKIDVTFDVPESSKKAVREALIDVKKYGVDGEEALEGVRRQWTLNKDASDEANRKIVEGAAAISKAYGDIDFKELIQETNEIASELKTSDEEALNLVNSLLKIGFPPEQLDIIAEYGGQLQRAGYEANEVKNIMASAVSTNSWNIDNLLDGLKEGRIRAAELGTGLSNGLKDNLRQVTGTVKAASDEELEIMRDGFDKKEKALEKSLSNQEKQLSKSHSNQQRALEKSLDAELKAFEKSSDRKMKLLDDEYMAKLKIIDEEKYNKIKAIDDEIKALEGLTEAEDKAAQKSADAEKRAELEKQVQQARTKHDRQKAEENLIKFNKELNLKAIQDERKDKVNALKDEKDDVKDVFDEKKDALRDEYDLKKDQLREINEAERESLQERHQLQKDALNERQSDEMSAIQERYRAELESYKKMNAEKLSLAKTPGDNAQFKALESQLENWGNAIAAGGEKGSKAFREMTAWLNTIENETLKNIIGTELFGTKWEDQGQHIIDAILGSNDSLKTFNDTTTKATETVDGLNNSSATVNLQKAFGELNEALRPVYNALAGLINLVADLMIKFPGLSALIIGLVSVVGMIAGALMGLAPIIYTISSLFGGGDGEGGKGGKGGKGGLMKVITKLFSWLGKLVRFLPLVARGFLLIGGPIGWIINIVWALIDLVPLVIKHWSKISKFFKTLWGGVEKSFKLAVKGIGVVAKGILGIIKVPVNGMIKLLNLFIQGVNKIKIPDWVPGDIGGKNLSIPEIPMLAKGTNFFKGKYAIVGEEGPELVQMPMGSKVNTARETAGMLSGGGELTINVPLSIDGRVFANAVAKYTNRELYAMQQRDVRGR